MCWFYEYEELRIHNLIYFVKLFLKSMNKILLTKPILYFSSFCGIDIKILDIYIFTNPSARAGYGMGSIFKRSLTGLNLEFSFF